MITRSFITTWIINEPGETIIIGTNLFFTDEYDYLIDWGDGTPIEHILNGNPPTHNFETTGEFKVAIRGDFPHIKMDDSPSAINLLSLEQWGTIKWRSFGYAFEGCANMVYNAVDAPDLSQVTNMNYMFANAISFDGNIGNWDTSNVSSMSYMFSGATSFNQNLNNWNVENVWDMDGMFQSASSFNGDITGWVILKTTGMAGMFNFASAFNQDLSNWDVSGVTNMIYMFRGATSFNQNLGEWNIESATNLSNMLDNSGVSPG